MQQISWEVMKIYPLKIYKIRYWEFLFINYVTCKLCVLCETGPVCFCRFIDYMLKTNVSTGSAFHYHDYVYVYLRLQTWRHANTGSRFHLFINILVFVDRYFYKDCTC